MGQNPWQSFSLSTTFCGRRSIMTSSSSSSSCDHPTTMLWQEAMGGLSAGIVGTVLGFPLDTLKARLQQQQQQQQPQSSTTRRGLLSLAKHVIQTEPGGIWALYRGLLPPLVSLSILNTVNFTSYSYFQNELQAQPSTWHGTNSIAGALCGYVRFTS